MRVLATGPSLSDRHLQLLEQLGYEVDYTSDLLSVSELTSRLREVDAYIFGGDEIATASAISGSSRLKIIAFLGTGYAELIDADAATKCGVAVTNTPGANAAAVAEITMGLILALERQIVPLNAQTKAGRGQSIRRRNIAGKRLGIVGLGAIGQRVAMHAKRGFNMDVVYAGPHPKTSAERELHIQRLSLDELLHTADFVTLHCPGATTEGLIGKRELEMMKPSAFLVNVAKAEIVDGDGLISALTESKLAGAAFDGYYGDEELRKRFFKLPDEKLVVLPRTAWLTDESFERMLSMAIENIKAYGEGKTPPNLVNPKYREHSTARG